MRDSNCDMVSRSPSLTRSIENSWESSQTSLNTVTALMSSCRICLSSFLNPAVLTCGHRFCEKCLDQYWRVREKPDCIVCPLCRACAFNVDFVKEGKDSSTEDFRRTFSPVVINELDINRSLVWCLKCSAFMPALYILVKWLKPALISMFSSIYLKFTGKIEI